MSELPRWTADIWYRTGSKSVKVQHFFEEISDLEDIVEQGADWNTIEKIEIKLARSTGRLTLEETLDM